MTARNIRSESCIRLDLRLKMNLHVPTLPTKQAGDTIKLSAIFPAAKTFQMALCNLKSFNIIPAQICFPNQASR